MNDMVLRWNIHLLFRYITNRARNGKAPLLARLCSDFIGLVPPFRGGTMKKCIKT